MTPSVGIKGVILWYRLFLGPFLSVSLDFSEMEYVEMANTSDRVSEQTSTFWDNAPPQESMYGLSQLSGHTIVVREVSTIETKHGEAWKLVVSIPDAEGLEGDLCSPGSKALAVSRGYEGRDRLLMALQEYLITNPGAEIEMKVVTQGRFNTLIRP